MYKVKYLLKLDDSNNFEQIYEAPIEKEVNEVYVEEINNGITFLNENPTENSWESEFSKIFGEYRKDLIVEAALDKDRHVLFVEFTDPATNIKNYTPVKVCNLEGTQVPYFLDFNNNLSGKDIKVIVEREST